MKTYCKPAVTDIENAEQNLSATRKCFDGKLKRKDFQRVLIRTGKITKREIAQARLDHDKTKVDAAIREVCENLTQRIRDRDLNLRPIRQFQRRDGLTHKLRDICQESPEQQIMEYMAVEALMPMFKAKLLYHQYGSIPNRGQVGGKRQIERLLRRKYKGRLDVVKCDVEKAYPSITVDCSMRLLRRDVGKNKILLWFLGALMENYPGGHLCIGGYLPAWLFNYVMSYVLRHLMELAYTRRGVRHRLVGAVVCFTDDFAVFGHFSQIQKAIRKTSRWSKAALGLRIKNIWQIYRISGFCEEKHQKLMRDTGSRKRTCGADMMGFVVYRTYTIIRGRIFRRIRRQMLRAARELDTAGYIPWWRACRLAAYKGWIKHSNSENFVKNYRVKEIMKKAAQSASLHGRKELIERERVLLIAAARG